MIVILWWLPPQTVFKDRIHFNSHFLGSDILPNTCNVSILGPALQGEALTPPPILQVPPIPQSFRGGGCHR